MKRNIALLLALAVFFLLTAFAESRAVMLPVLIYHHIADGESFLTIVSAERFSEQIRAVRDAGYQAVTINQVMDYVNSGAALPEKPMLITFDDGYRSNLELAAPVLEQYGMCATVFVIGSYAGRDAHPKTGAPLLPPHFALREALPYIESGVISLQYHSWDLHMRSDESPDGREGVLRREGEDGERYRALFLEDLRKAKEQFLRELGTAPVAYSYPYGFCSDETEDILTKEGVPVSFLAIPGRNRVVEGDPSTLRKLKRLTVTEEMSGKRLIRELERLG